MPLIQQLCLRFCPYFKPSKDETLACGGFLEVQRLVKKGTRISFENRGNAVGPETSREIMKKICPGCQFYEEDCDFILKGGDASPCGGFLLLAQLLDGGTISVDDIGEVD